LLRGVRACLNRSFALLAIAYDRIKGGLDSGPNVEPSKVRGESSGIPHLAKNERDAPNFLHAALDRTACAPFFKERRR
jgi:hypothetical protein